MRNFFATIAASMVFLVCAYAMVVAYAYAWGTSIDFASFAASTAFWSCAALTVASLSVGYAFCESLILCFARKLTVRLRILHAISFAFFVLAIIGVTFLPVADYSFAVLALVTSISTAAAFAGGYVRGWIIDHWTGGTRHGVLPA